MTRTVYFKTLGCKVNQYETQSMRERLMRRGFREIDYPEHADYVIVNSCTVTHHSDRKTRYYVRRFKKVNPHGKVLLTGCFTSHTPHEELTSLGADIILPQNQKRNVVHMLQNDEQTRVPSQTIFSAHDAFYISSFKGHERAFVMIQDGCTKSCSYCKVRLVRGPSRSRPLAVIKQEVEQLMHSGYQEIVLTGVELGAYGRDLSESVNLVTVLEEITHFSGIKRIRLSSIEPFDVTDELITFIHDHPKMCPHLHIPLQSGDNRILARMRRGYTAERYCDLIHRVRSIIPTLGFTTDVIVGFPGEDEAAFNNTLQVLEKTQPFKIHIFPFSPRQGTDAYFFQDTVTDRVKRKREQHVYQLQQKLFAKTSTVLVGSLQPVLIEHKGNSDGMLLQGHLPDYRLVHITSPAATVNTITHVRITACKENFLMGEIV